MAVLFLVYRGVKNSSHRL